MLRDTLVRLLKISAKTKVPSETVAQSPWSVNFSIEVLVCIHQIMTLRECYTGTFVLSVMQKLARPFHT